MKICQKFLTLYVVSMKERDTNTNGPPPQPSTLNPNIASVILHTVQYMLSSLLVRRICLIIKKCFTCISYFLTTFIFDWAELPRGEIKWSPMLGVLTRVNWSVLKPNPLLWDERWYIYRDLTVKPGQAPQEAINEFIIQKLNPLLVVDFRLISAFLYV